MTKFKLFIPVMLALVLLTGFLLFTHTERSQALSPQEWEGNWYFKDGGFPDYALNGVPDFDQKQGNWRDLNLHWSHCAPAAAANSLWWFDSKFETSPVGPPVPMDHYYLVESYHPGFDDHDPINVGGIPATPGLIDQLACYFQTNMVGNGTEVRNLAYGLQHYLYNDPTHPCFDARRAKNGSYYDDYHVQMVKMPTWEWVVEEVQRSEDVILLLGFWALDPSGVEPAWVRLGGHYVTVAGINDVDRMIAFSDPYFDNAETGQLGRIRDGVMRLHPPYGSHTPDIHNDAGNLSHDFYPVTLAPVSPAGAWEISNYPYNPLIHTDFIHQNTPLEYIPMQGTYTPMMGSIFVEVEYAVAMSPFKWKPGGEWVDVPWQGQWQTEWWWYEDDGDSCMPDFGWDEMETKLDGPAALANSLWWFDSKAETLVTGGFPLPPPLKSDHYSLVTAYDDWDDHDPKNTTPFINDLATWVNTTSSGTTPENMAAGIANYMNNTGVAQDFYSQTMPSPPFEWIADEVETCEDVLMLLGFYEQIDSQTWERKGGHWVNAAGVSRENNLLGLSDPAIDHAITESVGTKMHTGRVFPPERLGKPFNSNEKLHPQNISHDIYKAVGGGNLPGGHLTALEGYPATTLITSYIGMNGTLGTPWTGKPISTVVEWAIGVSPHSELVITKTAVMTHTSASGHVTYTLQYANRGLAAVHNMVIQDPLPAFLSQVSYQAHPPLLASPGITYAWTLPLLSYGQGGVISVSGVSPLYLTPWNEATITGTTVLGRHTPDRTLTNNRAHAGSYALFLPVLMR